MPNFTFSVQPFKWIAITTNITISISIIDVNVSPSVAISTGAIKIALMNHRNPRQIKTSNILLPMTLDKAMSPKPEKENIKLKHW